MSGVRSPPLISVCVICSCLHTARAEKPRKHLTKAPPFPTGTKVDVGYMMNTKLVNVKEKLLTSQFLDVTYDMNYFKSFAPEETVLQTFQVADRVQSLDLNNIETAVAAAFVAMQPGEWAGLRTSVRVRASTNET